jgi:hypothetical protein
MSDEILTVQEVTALLKVADKTVYTMAQKDTVAPNGFKGMVVTFDQECCDDLRARAETCRKAIEALLKGWHFPDLDRVSFSENDQDVVISGRARKSHGKGVRAITRAAFNLALLRLCVEDERPFPNFVLIDSPLLVYEEPDANESAFPQDIKKHFWESVKTSFAETQVIIIENSHQLPGDGTLSDVNVVLFTGNDQGRRGVIPQAAGVA